MDILRKELNAIYSSQRLGDEVLDHSVVTSCIDSIRNLTDITDGCSVITDASCDRSYLFSGLLGRTIGLTDDDTLYRRLSSSDEDAIYNRMHPADLAEKRMLEYEFFRFVDPLPGADKTEYKATCRIRLTDSAGRYILLDNSTQILRPSPAGKIWLILCRYNLCPDQTFASSGISPRIVSLRSATSHCIALSERRHHILTPREKEILRLIRDGLPSKLIADRLRVSIHTVSRHRQNILEKLSVANSVEAVTAATLMGLL